MKLRVFEAFSGYGSQSLALRNLGVDYEVVAISEIDEYALQAYYSLHDKSIPNLGDICKIKVEDIPQHDLFTYSFPCQDISTAGKRKGMEKGRTRSGLLYECERIIEGCKPKYLLLENVKNLVSKKFKPQFDKWLEYLEGLGYSSYWQVLNAKDYGVPQNRERVFVISILGEHKPYEFPAGIKLNHKLKDILENNTEDKYNLENVKDFFMKNSSDIEFKNNGYRFKPHIQRNISMDLNLPYTNFEYSTKELQKTILNNDHHNRFLSNFQVNDIMDKMPCGEEIIVIGSMQTSTAKGTNSRHWVHDINGIVGCISATDYKQPKQILDVLDGQIVMRRLTPREYFRLMGMNDEDIDKIQLTGVSNTQQYKMAGNSIVVNVLEAIFKNLLDTDN